MLLLLLPQSAVLAVQQDFQNAFLDWAVASGGSRGVLSPPSHRVFVLMEMKMAEELERVRISAAELRGAAPGTSRDQSLRAGEPPGERDAEGAELREAVGFREVMFRYPVFKTTPL